VKYNQTCQESLFFKWREQSARLAPLPAAAAGAKKAILAFVFIVLLALRRLSQNLNTTCHLGRQLYFIAAHNAHTKQWSGAIP
jgi:hypothetical protein